MKGVILYDQHGYRLPSGSRLYSSVLTPMSEHPGAFTNSRYDTDRMIMAADWKLLLSAGRALFALFPVVQGALQEQATYSFPLQARSDGADKAWGNLAEDFLAEWRSNPTILGQPFDGTTLARLTLTASAVDGDILRLKILDEYGFPRIQPIRAHRVGFRSEFMQDGRMTTGPYAGFRGCNGVVLDNYNRRVAFHILGDTPAMDVYVPAASVCHIFDPLYTDETRGTSRLAVAVRTFSDIKRLREFELRAMQVQSSVAITEANETGMPDEASVALQYGDADGATGGAQASLDIQTLEEGLWKYVKAGTGQKLEFHAPERPGENWQAFEQRMEGAGLYGIEWDPDFARMIKEPGGAWARIKLQKVNRRILKNASIEARAQKSEDTWAISQFIALGLLPAPSDGDIFSWRYHLALPQLTADSGNEENAKREAYKLGITTLLSVVSERGLYWEDVRQQREAEIRDKWNRVRMLTTEFADLGIGPQEMANEFEQKNPNGVMAVANVTDRSDESEPETVEEK